MQRYLLCWTGLCNRLERLRLPCLRVCLLACQGNMIREGWMTLSGAAPQWELIHYCFW